MNCNLASMLVAFLILGLASSALADCECGQRKEDEKQTRCRKAFEAENRKCIRLEYTYDGGCNTYMCICDHVHRKKLPLRDFDRCGARWGPEKACYKKQCRYVIRGGYDFKIYIGLQAGENTCHVDLYRRSNGKFVRHLDRNGKFCKTPTGKYGTCKGLTCCALADDSESRQATDDEKLTRCCDAFEAENRYCKRVEYKYDGGCNTYMCICDHVHIKNLPLRDFDRCGGQWGPEKACYKKQCRYVVRGGYDFRKYIGLQAGENTCHVDLYRRRDRAYIKDLDQTGKDCTTPNGFQGTCEGLTCCANAEDSEYSEE